MSELSTELSVAELPRLLGALRQAVTRPQPERGLVTLLGRLTGGYAEVQASWGDTVAQAGQFAGDIQTLRLTHAGRHVGKLRIGVPDEWQAMVPIAVEYALLARLQSAAAGAARRRVGERMLEALLSGPLGQLELSEGPFALALATLLEAPGRGTAAQLAHAHALDVLAGVGEGYLAERHLGGFCTVRGAQVLWLWSPQDLSRESRDLFTALTESTGQALKLGVSAVHPEFDIHAALVEATQALASLRGPGHVNFMEVDALHELLHSEALQGLRSQVRTQLAEADPDGKLENLLRAFLTHSGTLEELARKQRIHVNTLRYRLKVAERAVKGSLNDPATMSRLYLALGSS